MQLYRTVTTHQITKTKAPLMWLAGVTGVDVEQHDPYETSSNTYPSVSDIFTEILAKTHKINVKSLLKVFSVTAMNGWIKNSRV